MTSARYTYASALILVAIRRGHRYGFDIMDATGLPDGTIYPALRRMEERGLLAARWEDADDAHRDSRPARRYYKLTEAGEEMLRESLARYPKVLRLFPGADDADLAPA